MKKFPIVGILGGGQLGKMLCEAALPWHLDLRLLDKDIQFPSGPYSAGFVEGNFQDYDDVMAFGKNLDALTIEIESVNTKALKDLETSGVKVFPQPHIIELIQDKGLQKDFYHEKEIPTAPYSNLSYDELKTQVSSGIRTLPFVQKARKGGYDGKGVKIVRNTEDVMPVDSMVEQLADIEKEISVIVARGKDGSIVSYDPVEMVFDPVGNLVDYLIAPAEITQEIAEKADKLAKKVILELDMIGLLAVEMFLLKNGEIWVNEVAPRPHNSGHHTIKNTDCSQYEQLLRVLCELPLIPGKSNCPAMMVNILEAESGTGEPIYKGLDQVMSHSGIHLFLYGKKESRPYRKMGHFTITGQSREELMNKYKIIQDHFKITIS